MAFQALKSLGKRMGKMPMPPFFNGLLSLDAERGAGAIAAGRPRRTIAAGMARDALRRKLFGGAGGNGCLGHLLTYRLPRDSLFLEHTPHIAKASLVAGKLGLNEHGKDKHV